MLVKLVALLALASAAAMLLKRAPDDSRARTLEDEVAGQLNQLREHLFKS